MKIRTHQFAPSVFSVAIILFVSLALSSCARKISFLNSQIVPAAEGTVKVKTDNNNNYRVELNVTRLAEPKRLSPPRETYVVWMDTERNGIKNLGRLKSSSGLFSSSLKASLEAVTPFKPVSVFITAEDEPDNQYPGSQVVLRTENF